MKEIGIYIHIPFCIKKCKYCDFISFENKIDIFNEYIEALKKSINHCKVIIEFINNQIDDMSNKVKGKIDEELVINTIYIGGGTPSSIDSKYIIEIIKTIKNNFRVKPDAEITIEINPGVINETKLLDYKNAGINRISIGLQSTKNNILKVIGRIHTYEEFLETYKLVKKVGFDNINVDLMLALPNQTLGDLEDSLEEIISLNPNHISLYSLILEEGTPLYSEIKSGKLSLPQEEVERRMYHKTKKILEKNGYQHYEISNFSKSGCESKHNLNCWKQNEYIGFGLASHSYLNKVRFSNSEILEEFVKNIFNNSFEKNIEIHEIQTNENQMKEYMLLGFRVLNRNINL